MSLADSGSTFLAGDLFGFLDGAIVLDQLEFCGDERAVSV